MSFGRSLVSLFALVPASAALAAAPVASDVSMTQGADRTVTVAYTLSAPAVVTFDVVTNGPAGWVSIGGEHIGNVVGDVWKKLAAGAHVLSWRPDMSWTGNLVADGGAKAVVTAWAPEDTPDYMVVDIGKGAAAKTVRFYPSADFLPGGILSNADYRISKIVLRRIHAANVPWTMGTVFESGRDAATEAAHPVTLAEDYYIGVFELTQGQFQCIAGYNPSSPNSYADSPMYPLNCVAYNNFRCNVCTNKASTAYEGGGWPLAPYAGSFLDLLRTRTGLAFDLPSEAQWEFAGRSGTCEDQWNNGAYKTDATMPGEWKNGKATTAPRVCGSFEPSRWGLYDMHGNLFELCNDWWQADITALGGAPNVSASDPTKTLAGATGSARVRRGGAFHAGTSSVSYRVPTADPTNVASQWGFRLICPVGAAE